MAFRCCVRVWGVVTAEHESKFKKGVKWKCSIKISSNLIRRPKPLQIYRYRLRCLKITGGLGATFAFHTLECVFLCACEQ